mmetsp:Transcript_4969/g.5860  ORF Transcript_4969/g.5860 Transcript_4969/m.5860 type:complete len:170 (-) Transcript_4969:20-529(-)|eukprot:CAMPEP_0168320034 /NCGR_PEP_ID=MMETSP0213-20121227/1413_1 /TAXON_ID=151035 /ORGANISM="Euplotes harpa, Strain FSP1.4" /LENGTH=169 /DNA_ID=CAMNT_0008321373 /DNA_START=385 /DNA_END=894 /DNA_ORIENTATION=-
MNLINSVAGYASTHYSGEKLLAFEREKVYSVTNNLLCEVTWPKQTEGTRIIEQAIDELKQQDEEPSEETISQLLELLLTIGRINKVYKYDEQEAFNSGIFTNQGYWRDKRLLKCSTLSTCALVVTESADGLKGQMVERTYNLDEAPVNVEIDHEKVKQWIGEDLMSQLS